MKGICGNCFNMGTVDINGVKLPVCRKDFFSENKLECDYFKKKNTSEVKSAKYNS